MLSGPASTSPSRWILRAPHDQIGRVARESCDVSILRAHGHRDGRPSSKLERRETARFLGPTATRDRGGVIRRRGTASASSSSSGSSPPPDPGPRPIASRCPHRAKCDQGPCTGVASPCHHLSPAERSAAAGLRGAHVSCGRRANSDVWATTRGGAGNGDGGPSLCGPLVRRRGVDVQGLRS